MSIDLHCPQCQKLIRAPDNAGGRRGKCPYCGGSVYIPTPHEETEEIGLAPIDDTEEQQARQLRRESTQFTADVGIGVDGIDGGDQSGEESDAPGPSSDIDSEIEAFVIAMRDSQLDDAEAISDRLKKTTREARQRIQQMLAQGTCPEVADVPPPVVQGFVKSLLSRVK